MSTALETQEHVASYRANLENQGLSTVALKKLHAETSNAARATANPSERHSLAQEAMVVMETIHNQAPHATAEDRVAELRALGAHDVAHGLDATLQRREAKQKISELQDRIDNPHVGLTMAESQRDKQALKTAQDKLDVLVNAPAPWAVAKDKQAAMRKQAAKLRNESHMLSQSTYGEDHEQGRLKNLEADQMMRDAEQVKLGSMAAKEVWRADHGD